MQAARSDDEAQAVEQRALSGWKFSSVSMSVAYSKDRHQGRRRPEWRPNLEHHGGSKQDG